MLVWVLVSSRAVRAAKKVTVEIPPDLLRRAQRSTGEGITSTVRKGLELLAASRAYDELRKLKGRVRLSTNLESLRQDRR
jgi:hypothetical protein